MAEECLHHICVLVRVHIFQATNGVHSMQSFMLSLVYIGSLEPGSVAPVISLSNPAAKLPHPHTYTKCLHVLE